ncbi:hypothetical protein EV586_10770 [Tumebacillus sp. BK434]|uniref:permease prefix domain 1-containing protein n=1 Tax=Tumebacillus sp. BK434 TaxID=2512169 RepID=UPI001045001F|nr:permease prefix domain 1-containing protein [Tumebacillus sp. BK434]TCP52827.1 hypothetical protein EV586_10770 [Tumebacillus sp. BK434]
MLQEQRLSPNALQRIGRQVEAMCRQLDEPEAVISEFREEMTGHLIMSVEDLLGAGLPEEDALAKALERFGEPQRVTEELESLYRIRKTYARWLFKTALVFGLLGMLVIGSFFAWNEGLHNIVVKRLNHELFADAAAGKIGAEITPELQASLQAAVDDHLSLRSASAVIRDMKEWVPYTFTYPAQLPIDASGNVQRVDGLLFYTLYTGAMIPVGDQGKALSVTLQQWLFSSGYFMLGAVFLFAYWVLFGAWGILNVYSRRPITVFWALMIILFNALGYYAYLKLRQLSIFRPALAKS